MEGFWQDVKHSLRMLRQHPAFTATAIITLALGIGANTAIFSVINSVLLNPLPYGDPDRLVYINTTSRTFGPGFWPISQPNFVDFQQQNTVLEAMTATRNVTLNLTDGDSAERVEGARVSANTLRTLGLKPYAGRDFADDEEKPGAAPVAMIGYGFWQSRFAGVASAVGQSVGLDGARYTIIGILPPGFRFPDDNVSVWIPFVPVPAESVRGNFFLRPIGRLKQGVTLGEADAQMKTIAARLTAQYPVEYGTGGIELIPLKDRLVGSVSGALWILFGAVACVLLIACANMANLLLARAAGRSGELAIRTALGADRKRLLRQLLTESVLLSLLGAMLGLGLAAAGVRALTGMSAGTIPRASEIALDLPVLAFTALLGILTGIVFGLFPAMQLSRGSVFGAMRDSGRKGGTRGVAYRRALNVLVVAEVAVSLVLLAGAGLMLRSFSRLQQVNPGFAAEKVITFEMGASRARYPANAEQAELYRKVVEKVAAIPGVEHVAAANRLPIMPTGSATSGYVVEGRPIAPGTPGPTADVRIVTPGLFQALGIPLLQGRDFTERDELGATDVVIISEAIAKKEWPGESPIGKRIQLGALVNRWWEIVGVAGNIKLRTLDRDTAAGIYWPMKQNGFPGWLRTSFLMVRGKADPAALAPAIRAAVREVDREEGVATARMLGDVLHASVSRQRLNLALLLVFAGIAGVLAAVGIYGVMSYSVTQRTQEIGIRIALGASGGDVMNMVLRQGMMLVMIGVVAGVIGSLALARVIQSLLFNLPANDPATLISVSALLAAVALIATYVPARRATRVDPLIALRHE